MKRLTFLFLSLALMLTGCGMYTPLQKSQLIPVFHLIETNKYNEARGAVEDLLNDSVAAGWPRTWYARGLLSHNAWREGISKNDRKLTELYPDQLFVAYEAYQKADSLAKGGRMSKQLRPRYVLLANDFQRHGERRFTAREYKEALRAFEHSLAIAQRPELDKKPDTNLVYNTALAAYQSSNWPRAVKHLGRLHQYRFSENVAHLLFNAYLAKGDTLSAEKVMIEAIEAFPHDDNLVLLLADLYLKTDNYEAAINLLDGAIVRHPENFVFYNTKGLIFQKREQYDEAIAAYTEASRLAPEEIMIFVNIATCYYNIGVEIERNSLSLANIRLVQIEREKSARAFHTAITWLDKAYDAEPDDQVILNKLLDLYRSLRVNDKVLSLEKRIR